MTLLHCEGWDSRTFNLLGAYPTGILPGGGISGGYVTGRFGTGLGWAGDQYYSCRTPVIFPSAQSVVYTGFAIRLDNSYSNPETILLDFFNGSTSLLNLRMQPANSGTAGSVRMVRGSFDTGGTDLGTLPTGTIPSYAWTHLELKLVCGTGTSGSVVLRKNGVPILTLTGIDTGSASVTGMVLGLGSFGGGFGSGNASQFDDWWVCNGSGATNNDYLGDLRILTMVPQGAGSSTQLTPSTGSNWSCVDEIPPDVNDYVSGLTAGLKDLYDYTPLNAAYTTVKGIRLMTYAYVSDAGPLKGRVVCKSGATTSTGADLTLSPTVQISSLLLETDPNTSALWTNANLNAAEFGWEIRP